MRMATAKKEWTLAEVHSLPDDGNKYELVHGELFVTPPTTAEHETIAARLARLLDRYVEAHGLGLVYRPRAVMRVGKSEVEPDLMVRDPGPRDADWASAPVPRLVVEIFSGATRRRDQLQKRALYREAGVPEYWMVDPERREVIVVRGNERRVESDRVHWHPPGAREPLALPVDALFDQP